MQTSTGIDFGIGTGDNYQISLEQGKLVYNQGNSSMSIDSFKIHGGAGVFINDGMQPCDPTNF